MPHTPGPWHKINDVCVGGPIEPGWEAAGCGIAHCGMRARTTEEAAANATLIAAAPDMYSALVAMIEKCDEPHAGDDTYAAYKLGLAALTKARGETTTEQ